MADQLIKQEFIRNSNLSFEQISGHSKGGADVFLGRKSLPCFSHEKCRKEGLPEWFRPLLSGAAPCWLRQNRQTLWSNVISGE